MDYTLDYLFIAECQNGFIIRQTPEDTSLIDPTKSAFYDVLQNLPLKRFSLAGKGHVFTVDLVDGHVEIDGRVVPTPKRPHPSAIITPIYFRDVIQTQKTEIERRFTKKIFGIPFWVSHITDQAPSVKYRIGWQANYKGKNQKYEMTIN